MLKIIAFLFSLPLVHAAPTSNPHFKFLNKTYFNSHTFIPGRRYAIYALTSDSQDRIYIGDYHNNRITIYDKNFKLVNKIYNIQTPHGVHVTDDGSVYVASFKKQRIRKFNHKHEEIAQWDQALSRFEQHVVED